MDLKRILFIDDNKENLFAYRRMLHPASPDWYLAFAASGTGALKILKHESFDVIISNIGIRDMDGIQLQEHIRMNYPEVVRIAILDRANQNASLRAFGSAHQFLTQPFTGDDLRYTINHACTLSGFVGDPKLQKLLSRIRKLPTLPNIYLQIFEALNSADPSPEHIGEIISQDMGMTTKILQIVNSAYFGMPREINDPIQATVLLGTETIRDLTLTLHLFAQFDQRKLKRLGLTTLWTHSLMVGTFAKKITREVLSDRGKADEAFIAGLLHDIGKLIFANNLTESYINVRNICGRKGHEIYEAELEVFEASHSQVGAYLMGLWGLSPDVVEAAAFHHKPSQFLNGKFTVSTAVHIANAIDYQLHPNRPAWAVSKLDLVYLKRLKIDDQIAHWREMCSATASEIARKPEVIA
jgi:putative nucleotidyltransferase with HDIG domain